MEGVEVFQIGSWQFRQVDPSPTIGSPLFAHSFERCTPCVWFDLRLPLKLWRLELPCFFFFCFFFHCFRKTRGLSPKVRKSLNDFDGATVCSDAIERESTGFIGSFPDRPRCCVRGFHRRFRSPGFHNSPVGLASWTLSNHRTGSSMLCCDLSTALDSEQ